MKNRRSMNFYLWMAFVILFIPGIMNAGQEVSTQLVSFIHRTDIDNKTQEFFLKNECIQCLIKVESGKLISDDIRALPRWLSKFKNFSSLSIETDGDFMLDVMWTDWSAPGKVNNADNLVEFTKSNFQFAEFQTRELQSGAKELDLIFKGARRVPLEVRLTYKLEPDEFYVRRKLAVRATAASSPSAQPDHHFLRWLWPERSVFSGQISVIKPGGFGQPVAFTFGKAGAFFGLEYPSSNNKIRATGNENYEISCGQEIGLLMADSWIESEWVVEGLSPDVSVKTWFAKYIDKIRVAQLKPYILYNSWYDLRAPEYVRIPERSLTENNVLKTIESFQKRMFEKRCLSLDAFVLDDGWDIYQSDWILNKDQFPNGLAPLVAALKPMGTKLGIWIGPIGGYSNRKLRIEYMKSHGYEVTGDQMCLAGTNYKALLKKRVTDFVRNGSVGYFKWDGIQFSCSEPDHGHLPDIYSRRAVMEAVIDLCRSVRAENRDVFLNITSGTWLSPWWLKHANTIWMQGADYGYSDVPSISLRDSAMTYRDSVLHFDLIDQNFWFPIANLMTHGIIKGHLQMLGGREETLDKFTSEVLFYFARGIAMWELYISPDLLTDKEWDALAAGICWAKDRFDLLSSTEMIGGDPDKLEPYGYAHFKEKRGILAVRNPGIEPKILTVSLSPSFGLCSEAENLVLEKIYPARWISTKLFASESSLEIPLQGYETAIYELYPLEEAQKPLLAGVTFDVSDTTDKSYKLKFYNVEKEAKLLNPDRVSSIDFQGKKFDPSQFSLPTKSNPGSISGISFKSTADKGQQIIDLNFNVQQPAREVTLAFLLQASEESRASQKFPEVRAFLDGKKVEPKVERKEGSWAWYKIKVSQGRRQTRFEISSPQDMQEWKGSASAWIVCLEKLQSQSIAFSLKKEIARQRPMPPLPFPEGQIEKIYKLGDTGIKLIPV